MSASSDHTYLPGSGLQAVIDLALELGQPLLVTGEPGTGKTQLAYHVARQQGLERPLVFNVKTDSQARDLFYRYDAIRHYRDSARDEEGLSAMSYVTFEALGKAILQAGAKQSVVLIDEIDKAPRDFANDLLYEFDELAFQVKEASAEETKAHVGPDTLVDEQGFIQLPPAAPKPILILTSNSEKNLPDAFLRRVLYHHIEFPERDRLQEIIDANAPADAQLDQKLVLAAIAHFEDIREHKRLRKRPATAELLAWVHVLQRRKLDLSAALKASGEKALKEEILNTYALLAKNKEDLDTLKRDLGL